MILRKVLLENFGIYGGTVEIDLAPRMRGGERRPIVLVGGKNGAGKTTLLEAVRLALYGRLALGARVALTEYDDYLRRRVHRPTSAATPPTEAAVGVEFDYAENGVVHQYRVRRAWSVRGRSVVESLVLERDQALVTGIPREEWQHFLRDLIPQGVSQLFFFDGEKIREMAGDPAEEHLAHAIRGLLGLELVARLRTDLGLYVARQQTGEQEALAHRLEATVREIHVLDERIGAVQEDAAQLAATRDSQARVADQARRRFVAEGGELAARRTQLVAESEEIERRVSQLQAELRDHAQTLLPFVVAPKLTAAFQAALRSTAAEVSERPSVVASLRDALARWREGAPPPPRAAWGADHWSDLDGFLQAWAEAGEGDHPRALDPAVIGDRRAVLAHLDQAEVVTRPRMFQLAEELAVLYARQEEVEAMLLRADSGESNILLDELRLAEQRLGGTEVLLQAREEDLHQLRVQRTALERERARILEQQNRRSAAEHRTDLATRAARALAEYEQRLLDHKLAQLRTEFVECFRRLLRKPHLIHDVRIDSESFQVVLVDADGHEVPRGGLSAGEQQIYAVAMLWALARTSGRALPMIIDTPLARLDAEHRANLVEHYLPEVSHQVVVLSTDMEIDPGLAESLGPHVSHSFCLDFDSRAGHTVLTDGYFWPVAEERKEERALQQA